MASERAPDPPPPAAGPPRRRRRTPEQARAEILAAAGALLAERGPQALNVAEVMKRTTLSRKAFYVHFSGRTELLLGLLSPLRAEADAALDLWRTGDAFEADGHAALLAAARVYRAHGAALRAVFWAGGEDAELAAVREGLTAPIRAAARAAVDAAHPPFDDPGSVALALATMNVHLLLEGAPGATDADLDRLADALYAVWARALGRT